MNFLEVNKGNWIVNFSNFSRFFKYSNLFNRPKKKPESKRYISPHPKRSKLNLFEEIERDQKQFLKEVSEGVYSKNVNTYFKKQNKKEFKWDITSNKKVLNSDSKNFLKIKVTK